MALLSISGNHSRLSSLFGSFLVGAGLVCAGFYAGIAQAARVTNGLQVLYEFNETSGSTISDTSGVGTPLNLTVLNTADVSLNGERIDINNATILETSQTNDKIYQACKLSNELTVEAWVMADNLDLYGPARLVTHSSDGGARNFTLAQEGSGFVARLGTSTNTHYHNHYILNATVSTSNLQHIVFSRDASGQSRFYLDGNLVDSWNWDTVGSEGDFSTWQPTRKLAIANENAWTGLDARDWLGEIHLVAVYSRALTSSDVADNYAAGANPSGPSISYSGADPVNFGTTTAGSTVQRTITIDNVGTDPLDINSLQISGVNASKYEVVSDDCVNGMVQPASSCTITIEFSP